MAVRFFSLIVILAFLVPSYVCAFADEPIVERWDRAVCLKSPPPKGQANGPLASAFIVSEGTRLFLVTASHAAKQTKKETRLLYRSAEGKPEWVSLAVIVPKDKDPWVRHKNSDIAIAKINLDESNSYFRQLSEIAIPLQSISVKPVARMTPIEIAGFPFGLGIKKQVSPLVVAGHIASGEILTDNEWGSEPLIYSSPDIAQGTSGAPAFLATKDSKSVTVVGMYVAVIYDASGGKLSKLVPAHIIHEAIVARNSVR